MNRGFWDTLSKPFFVLAPMADVTDAAFRRLIAKYSKPDGPSVMWTEFVSADGLAFAPEEGRKKLLADLIFTEAERPIVAQFFTSRPETMEKAAALAHELGFDGVDINMGCPDSSIEKQKAGAAMMKDPALAKEIIFAAKAGAKELPVSVKTRLGYNKDELEEWLPQLLSANPAVITLHARTRKEMSLVPARWERVKRAVEIRDELNPNVFIMGNGDIQNMDDARQRVANTGADGAMMGKAIFGSPWLFSSSYERWKTPETLADRLRIMVEHTKLYQELLPHKSFAIMKKHYKAYVSGFDGASELRAQLMAANSADEIASIVEKYIVTLTN
jgi:nifR3 family TIM-barrel protein